LLRNFPISALDEEVALDPVANTQIDAQEIYEVLVCACADGTTISALSSFYSISKNRMNVSDDFYTVPFECAY